MANGPDGSSTRPGFSEFKAVFAARTPLKGPENNNVFISVNIPEKRKKAFLLGVETAKWINHSAEIGRVVNEIFLKN